jgi:hypothetical protein
LTFTAIRTSQAFCWDQIVKGYSILNTGKYEGGLAKDGGEGVNNSVSGNKCTGFLLWGNPQGFYL